MTSDIGTWEKRCHDCGTVERARSYDELVVLSRKHQGHYTEVSRPRLEVLTDE